MSVIKSHRDLIVYQKAFDCAMEIFEVSGKFPKEEIYSLTDQIRRSSRSVCANIAEAFRRRKYPKSFVSKLNESEAEVAETQNWIDFAKKCQYLDDNTHKNIDLACDEIIKMLVSMQINHDKWSL